MKIVTGIVTFVLLAGSTHAQSPAPPASSTPSPAPVQTPPATEKARAIATPARHSLAYNPPKGLLSGTRVDGDGGSRGSSAKLPSLYVLTPNQTALTTQAQPSLFWYQSGPAATHFELTLVEPGKPKPLLKIGTDKAGGTGIHRLPLGKYHVTLTPGVFYKWTVALVPDPANRSEDLVASGTIQRAEPDPEFTAALTAAEGPDKAALFATKGFWYDALEAVTNQIDAAPKDKALRLQRASLLEAAGLKEAATSDRKQQ
jgi:hypothetical protein